jgi:cystathionine beta-synthase
MSTYNVSQLPVVEGADCLGSVSEGWLTAKALSDGSILERPVRDTMEPPYPVVNADLPVESLAALLGRGAPAALIRDNGNLSGIVTRYDVLRHVAKIR